MPAQACVGSPIPEAYSKDIGVHIPAALGWGSVEEGSVWGPFRECSQILPHETANVPVQAGGCSLGLQHGHSTLYRASLHQAFPPILTDSWSSLYRHPPPPCLFVPSSFQEHQIKALSRGSLEANSQETTFCSAVPADEQA